MFLKDRQLVGLLSYAPPSLCRIDDDGDAAGGGGLEALIDGIVTKAAQPEPVQAGDGDADGAETPQQNQAAADDADGDDGAPDEDQLSAEDEDEGSEQEPDESPLIEPPLSWSKEHKQEWAKLPRETQEYLHSREQQRDAEVRRSQNEAAELRRSIDGDRAALAQERQRYADQLNTYIALTEALDPIIAEGNRTDWAAAAGEDPAGTQQKWFAFTQRQAQLRAAVQQRDALFAQHTQEHLAREGQRLIESVPEWADPDPARAIEKATAGITEIRAGVIRLYGYKPEEVAVIHDSRVARMAKDALAYHALKAESAKKATDQAAAAKALQQKRVAPAAPRIAASAGQDQSNVGVTRRSANSALRKLGKDPTQPDGKRLEGILAQL